MPMGLTNAPATFQRMMDEVLQEYIEKFVIVYLDDILIYSENEKQHQEHVKAVLQKLKKARLRINAKKSEWTTKETGFLGVIIRPGEMAIDPTKIKAIIEWPQPANVKQIQGFLGTANFNRRFIEGYSQIAAPLTALTKKDTPFFWTKEKEQKAFAEIKRKSTNAPVLIIFDPTKPSEVDTDASDAAIGARLGQRDKEGRLHPVAYYSRKLSPAELNYDIHDKELLAIVEAFKEWRVYLQGAAHTTTVYTDHKNLIYFTTTKQLNRRQTRWSETLATYDFKITYKRGAENPGAHGSPRNHLRESPGPGEWRDWARHLPTVVSHEPRRHPNSW